MITEAIMLVKAAFLVWLLVKACDSSSFCFGWCSNTYKSSLLCPFLQVFQLRSENVYCRIVWGQTNPTAYNDHHKNYCILCWLVIIHYSNQWSCLSRFDIFIFCKCKSMVAYSICQYLVLLLVLCCFVFWDGNSLHSSDWPRISYIDQAGLELTETRLPLRPKCWDERYVPPCLADFTL